MREMKFDQGRRGALRGGLRLGFGIGAAMTAGGLLTACGKKAPKALPVASGATVLALGDSLTFGNGATPENAYPAVLAGITGWNVVNAGISGNTSSQALERLPELLVEHKPVLVLVCIGGNDFLRGMSDADTRANVRSICQQSKTSGAQVMLVAVPRVSAMAAATNSLKDHAMFEELAKEMKLPLHDESWAGILSDASLRSDQVHANAKGYDRFARELHESLKEAGFLG